MKSIVTISVVCLCSVLHSTNSAPGGSFLDRLGLSQTPVKVPEKLSNGVTDDIFLDAVIPKGDDVVITVQSLQDKVPSGTLPVSKPPVAVPKILPPYKSNPKEYNSPINIIDGPIFLQDPNFEGPLTASGPLDSTGPISVQDLNLQGTINNAGPSTIDQLNSVGPISQGPLGSQNNLPNPVNIIQGSNQGPIDLGQTVNTGPVNTGDLSQVSNVVAQAQGATSGTAPVISQVPNVPQLGLQMVDGGIDGVDTVQPLKDTANKVLPQGRHLNKGLNHETIQHVLPSGIPGQAYECKLVSMV